MKKAVVIVEAISTGVFYEQDILDRGYQPLVISKAARRTRRSMRASGRPAGSSSPTGRWRSLTTEISTIC